MDRCRRVLYIKNPYCEFFRGFHRQNFVVYPIPGFFPIIFAYNEKLFLELQNNIHDIICNICIFLMILYL